MKTTTVETPVGRIFARLPPEECVGLDINRAADYLGIGRSKTYKLLSLGLIQSVHIGKRRIILR